MGFVLIVDPLKGLAKRHPPGGVFSHRRCDRNQIVKQKNSQIGRPRKPYRASWGEHVNGLRRRKSDGRWVIVETGQTFTEADERRAVQRFKRWQADQQGESIVELVVKPEVFETKAGYRAAFESGASIQGHFDGSTTLATTISKPVLWAWLREQLIARPEYIAKNVGIPELARLADLPKPKPSPTLKAIGDLYQEKNRAKAAHRRRMEMFWGEFKAWMSKQGVTTLRQLTAEVAAEYADHAIASADAKGHGKGGSPKYLKHRFTAIRSHLHFALKRGQHPADLRHAIDCCAVLQAPKHISTRNPHPISPEHFHQLLNTAVDPRMKACLLVMLNLCMYPSEALALDWREINLKTGAVQTHRSKSTIIRIGILWPRTIEAIRALVPRRKDDVAPIFISREGSRWNVKTVSSQFRDLRKAAGVPYAVKSEDCRDGAYTTAIEWGADLTLAKLLGGHGTGISDHYAKRRPKMVAEVCAAIEREYFDDSPAL